jgi:hypothetical protein
MKYYLFIDESGDHGLVTTNPDFPVFVLCGILISENCLQSITNDIVGLKSHFWGDKKVILHSRDIRKCNNEFAVFFNQDVKQEFYEKLNSILAGNNYSVIASAILKDNYIKKYGRLASDVYELALSFIIERAVFYLNDLSEENCELEIIIERRGKREDK